MTPSFVIDPVPVKEAEPQIRSHRAPVCQDTVAMKSRTGSTTRCTLNSRVGDMADDSRSEYEALRDRARAAIARQKEAAEQDRLARADRDVAVVAMLATPGASLGSVAADVGLSKSMVAYIERTARATFENADAARAYLEQRREG